MSGWGAGGVDVSGGKQEVGAGEDGRGEWRGKKILEYIRGIREET